MYTLQSALYNLGLTSVDTKTMWHAIVCFSWRKSSCKWTCAVQICVVRGVTDYVTQFVFPLISDELLGCISLLAVVNGAGMNIHVEASVGVHTSNFFVFRPRNSIFRSYGNFNFLRNLWTLFHSGHIIFHSPQQDTGFQCLPMLPPLVNPVRSCYIQLFLIFTLKLS